jgi:cytochrome c oxidase assembly protein subunit 15
MRLFHQYSRLTLLVGLVLIWWGAAVTTEDVGLAVPDWPLCFGKLNPEGWYQVPALLLEHGHRWIATTIGFLVLGMYFWQFVKCRPSLLEAVSIIFIGTSFLFLVFKGQLIPAIGIVLAGMSWLSITWSRHRWSLLRGLTTLALFTVIGQASLGGLRVLKMSDPYGISHGTLGQLFFCLLVFIAFASSRTWHMARMNLSATSPLQARLWSTLLFFAVFGQLVIGATLRHTQRLYLAASDIFTTKGQLFPPLSPADVFVLHLHKYWGFTVAILVIIVAWKSRRWFDQVPRLRWIPAALFSMPVIQVTLGIYVILTGKSFWVTNFHVLNGLGILVISFVTTLCVWASTLGIGLVGEASPDKSVSVS